MDLITKLPLPMELNHLISEFIRRPDWKTCRKHEADLIRESYINMTEHLGDPAYDPVDYIFSDPTVLEITRWTLYGKLFIVKWLESGCSRTGIGYGYYDHYTKWYTGIYILLFIQSCR
jgi:hypothetical protein